MQKLNVGNPQALKSENNRLNQELDAKKDELQRYEKRFRQLEN